MPSLLTINWNPDPELFNLFGSFPIRYYGLLWGIGIVLSCIIVQRQYRDRKISEDKFTPLFFYCVIGITLGARLGHCIFYDWSYYQNHLIEMILQAVSRRRLEMDRLQGTCQSWRHPRTNHRPVAILP